MLAASSNAADESGDKLSSLPKAKPMELWGKAGTMWHKQTGFSSSMIDLIHHSNPSQTARFIWIIKRVTRVRYGLSHVHSDGCWVYIYSIIYYFCVDLPTGNLRGGFCWVLWCSQQLGTRREIERNLDITYFQPCLWRFWIQVYRWTCQESTEQSLRHIVFIIILSCYILFSPTFVI